MTRPLNPLSFPLHGARLIEASAGTGKTYTIAGLYLRLVLGHGGENGYLRPLTPPEILVVTFTKAATQELRDRIRNRLTEAAAAFRSHDRGDADLESLRNEYPGDQWLDAARVLEQAAQWMDEAAIYTIHSWSQRMLRQHAFDCGNLFDLELEPEDQDLLEAAACDYWRSHFYAQPPESLSELLGLINCSTPQALLGRVRPLLNAPLDQAHDPFRMLDQRRQAIEAARQKWASDFQEGVDIIRKARADKTLNGNKYRLASLEKWIDQLTDWISRKGPLPEVTVRHKLSYPGLKDGTGKNKSLPKHLVFDIFEQLEEQLKHLNVSAALLNHAARDIARRFQREKQRRGQLGYDDLLTRLNDALQKPEGERLAKVIRQQFPVALIDEFQDTDPVQYAAFSKIYLDRPDVGLFMIGDPKQAIYAFRGADIHTYLQARRKTGGRLYTLGKNYRSTQGVVQAVNQMFETAAEHPKGAFMFNDQIPFDPVDTHGRKEQFYVAGEPKEGLYLWQLPQDKPVPKTGDKGYLQQMADAFASEIVRLLNLARQHPAQAGFQGPDDAFAPLRPSDMAILVRDGNEAKTIRRALDQRNVRSVYLSDKDSIFDSREAQEMLYLLWACAEPKQPGHLKAALATSVLDLPLQRLDDLNMDETAWEAEVDRFCRYQQIWRRQGVLPMIRALLQEFGAPARLLSLPGGERSLTNLLHLAELLQTEATALDGEPALIRWLSEMITQPSSGTDEQLLRLESDDALIRVITIHKSKGLEYPLVFLPFICSFRQVTRRNAPVVQYHDENGRLKLVQNPEDKDLNAADQERLAEDLRLLYVAVTRPRFACWLGIGVMGTTKTSHLHLSGFGYLLSAGTPVSMGDVSQRLLELKGDCPDISIAPVPPPDMDPYHPPETSPLLAQALEFKGRVPSNWWIASYSAILGSSGRMVTTDSGDMDHIQPPAAAHSAVEDQLNEVEIAYAAGTQNLSAVRSIHHFPRGPQPGTFLHGLLEWAAGEGFHQLAQNREHVYNKLQHLCAPRGWHAWVEILTDWFQRLLQTPLILPDCLEGLALADLKTGSYQPELEFMFAAHQVDTQALDRAITADIIPGAVRPQLNRINVNGMLKGFVDLAFCHQGRYYVMDYKSNYLGENDAAYGIEMMTHAMLEHRYDLQYVLYTLAMHRLLKSRVPDYDYQRHMGGAVYLFLRGIDGNGGGVYVDKPPWPLIAQLDKTFADGEDHHASQ